MLLSAGAAALLATFVLPQLIQRLFAFPVSAALIALGFSLWRAARNSQPPTSTGVSLDNPHLASTAGVE